MLLAAATDLQLDLSRSLLVGDRLSDLQAGARAGLPWLAQVLSGHGQQERAAVQHWWAQTQKPTGENANRELVLLQSLLEFPVDRFTEA
jgi:D-glycero-D-manno-heptose 1,7-bisphosphate phosphatase